MEPNPGPNQRSLGSIRIGRSNSPVRYEPDLRGRRYPVTSLRSRPPRENVSPTLTKIESSGDGSSLLNERCPRVVLYKSCASARKKRTSPRDGRDAGDLDSHGAPIQRVRLPTPSPASRCESVSASGNQHVRLIVRPVVADIPSRRLPVRFTIICGLCPRHGRDDVVSTHHEGAHETTAGLGAQHLRSSA